MTAIELADWVVFGPGSWYTSVLPHFMLPELRSALAETEARRCVVMNLLSETDETIGMTPRIISTCCTTTHPRCTSTQ